VPFTTIFLEPPARALVILEHHRYIVGIAVRPPPLLFVVTQGFLGGVELSTLTEQLEFGRVEIALQCVGSLGDDD
jgi:hypothetical protein